MDEIIEILSDIKPGVDFSEEERIFTDRVINSIDLVGLVSALEEEFDIEIGMELLEASNFDSVSAIWDMVCELQDE